MNIGKKIQTLRKFRCLTQAELGIAIGFKPESAANRITQYETNYRVPKEDALSQMADVLNVSKYNFIDTDDVASDFILSLFWIDPKRSPMPRPFIEFKDDSINSYLVEWNRMRTYLYDEKINKEQYLDWKFNWFERKCEPSREIKYRAEELFPD